MRRPYIAPSEDGDWPPLSEVVGFLAIVVPFFLVVIAAMAVFG